MKAFLKMQDDHKSVVNFNFTDKEAASINWEEEGEFSYHGQMYDVIETKKENGQLIIRCIADKDETALIEQFRKQNERSRSTSSLLQLITAACVLPSSQELAQPEKIIQQYFSNPSPSICQQASAIFIPPPEV